MKMSLQRIRRFKYIINLAKYKENDANYYRGPKIKREVVSYIR